MILGILHIQTVKVVTGILIPMIALLAISVGCNAQEELKFREDFEGGVGGWWATKGLLIESVTVSERNGRCLNIKGLQRGTWRYAISPKFEIAKGEKYRLTAWVNVKEIAPSHPPYVVVEFWTSGGKRLNKIITTPKYNLQARNWQELSKIFEVPEGSAFGRIIFQKGGVKKDINIDACLDDISVVMLTEGTRPAQKEEEKRVQEETDKRNVSNPQVEVNKETARPFLHLTSKRILDLKQKIKTEPYATLFKEIRDVADIAVKFGPPPYLKKHRSGNEQLWQREVGNMIPHLAIMYLMTDDRKYLDAAQKVMLASAGYKTWGLGREESTGLAAAHQLYGLALGYDWLFDKLDPGSKRVIKNCLKTRGQIMYHKLLNEEVWWHKKYLMNHMWVKIAGLAAAGFTLSPEEPDVKKWILLSLSKLEKSIAALGDDGVSHEGVAYWSYGLEYLLKFMDLARQHLGKDLFRNSEWFKNTASFRLYAMLPKRFWTEKSNAINFSDGPRGDYGHGPDYLLRKLAAEYRDPYAQWLAQELDNANLTGIKGRFLNLIWYDPSITPKSPVDLSTFKHFKDMDIVVMRSDWKGNEALMAFRCGPHLGHHALKRFDFDPGAAHVHPDAGTYQIFAYGDWLIVPDGYSLKKTKFQNTILVNGIGQEFEGGDWKISTKLFREKRGANIVKAVSGVEFDIVLGNAQPAYGKDTGLKKYLRHILYLKPACWVIVDELETAHPSQFELILHSDFPPEKKENNAYRIAGPQGSMDVALFCSSAIKSRTFKQKIDKSGRKQLDALAFSNLTNTNKLLFVTVLYAYPTVKRGNFQANLKNFTGGKILTLSYNNRNWSIQLELDRSDASQTIFRIIQ